MGFNRVDAKLSARESMRVNRPSSVLVTLVYFLLTSGLLAVVTYFVRSDLLSDVYYLLWSGYSYEEILPYIWREYQNFLILFFFIDLVWMLYSTLMNFGYTSYALRMARNEQPGYGHLLDGFARSGRVLWAAILVEVFTLLWSLVVILPLCVLIILVGAVTQSYEAVLLVTLPAMLAVIAACIAIPYRYRMTSYFLLDHPDCTAREAIRRGVDAMRGWKGNLFALDLSFLGWMLLTGLVSTLVTALLPALPGNILLIWVLPYYTATQANFYDCITGAWASGDAAGPSYDLPLDGPTPF